jgi:hypothetical protein
MPILTSRIETNDLKGGVEIGKLKDAIKTIKDLNWIIEKENGNEVYENIERALLACLENYVEII